ncbi:MAG: hypothetical protein ABF449_12335 [Ethanoligenens sp.]
MGIYVPINIASAGAIAYGVTSTGVSVGNLAKDVGLYFSQSNNSAGNSPSNGSKMTTNEALDAAEKFFGTDYKEIAPGVFRSNDGLRQVRMTDSDITGTHAGGAHMNFKTGKTITKPSGKSTFDVNQNIHVFLTD